MRDEARDEMKDVDRRGCDSLEERFVKATIQENCFR